MTYPNGRILHYGYNPGMDATLSRLSYLADDNGGGGVGQHLEEYTYQFPLPFPPSPIWKCPAVRPLELNDHCDANFSKAPLASAFPCSAASRNNLITSTSSFATPLPWR
jgi:hypothetical protein